jgi:hypothetical protein
MAPKKSLLLITAIILTIGLATAQSSASNEITDISQKQVWLNSEEPEVEFQASYDQNCEADPDTREASVTLDGQSSSAQSFEVANLEDIEAAEADRTYNFTFSDFDGEGLYNIEATCEHQDESKNVDSGSDTFTADDLEFSGLQLGFVESDRDGVAYVGEEVDVSFQLESSEDLGLSEFGEKDFNYNLEGLEQNLDSEDIVEGTFQNNNGEVSFSFEASSGMKGVEGLGVSAKGFDGVGGSTDLDVQPVWQFNNVDVRAGGEDITDRTVKYRYLSSLELTFQVTEKGDPVKGLTTDSFLFDDESGWFIKEDEGSGNYRLELEGRPQYTSEELNVDESYDLPIELDTGSVSEEIVELTVEKDVEFSGNVLDVSNNRVDTSFEAIIEREDSSNRLVPFSTDDSGYFEQYFETDTVDMEMKFPEATVSLSEMDVGKDDAGDISYQYYSDLSGSSSKINPEIGVRPVNVAAFVSNYPFQADSLDTFVEMQYDTSDVDPLEVVVYECSQWTFDAEECSSDWEKISDNDVNLESGSTWKANFPIEPLTSDRFATDEGVLQNAYLVGVQKGVGEGLTLDSSLDVSSRVKSGEEFSISGRVISDSTGESVEGADISLTLSSEENEIELEEVETDSNGNFELSTVIEDGGSYSVELDASKNPYDSLSVESNSMIEVFYETGLSVSAESDPEVTLGEPYDIDYTVENIGQAPAEDIELSVSGVDSDEYDLVPRSIGSIEAGESSDVVLTLDLSEDLVRPPTINFEASGTSSDKDVRGSATTSVSFAEGVNTESSDTDESQDDDNQEDTQDSQSSSSLPNVEDVTRATGEFVQSQSDMNLALGLILVFGVVLAAAVRKRKEGNGSSRGNDRMGRMAGGQGRVQKPNVSPTKVEPDESEEDTESEAEESEEQSSGDSESELVCDTCGESFDTESGLKLHQQALH